MGERNRRFDYNLGRHGKVVVRDGRGYSIIYLRGSLGGVFGIPFGGGYDEKRGLDQAYGGLRGSGSLGLLGAGRAAWHFTRPAI